ncbi:DEAD/DEAH box helicase [Curvibacter sp. CHRR-16]|uniref:3'-5' exonuclease n=1 Tax=Curvibacter sp. CHRR-16 TaxID=2835872 RepID=UPI001BDA7123|nr:3'-5' exonuclease [Curvibacter sp. CHRR-16]MBT0570388.1 DEAD/DEAH box helicase [Curvibacter sp. CHRR-16]
MATLIPAIGSAAFDSTGEHRLAERLEQKLDAITDATRQYWTILDGYGQPKVVINPLAQARHCAIQVVNALERDPQLVQESGPHQGKLPDIMRVMDLQQEQLARSLAYGQDLPANNQRTDALMAEMVERVIRGVDMDFIPRGQYQAILIDEGHDFAPEWLKLITQMVDPSTNSLLVLYDDAQSIYERARSKQFSFKSVGIQAQGRTTILKINYRNTKQILNTASLVAADLLTPDDKDDDGVPLLQPMSCGREGQEPIVIKLPTLRDEAYAIADHLASAHKEGFAWGDMAVLCADWKTMDVCAEALAHRHLPHRVRKQSGDYQPGANAIQVMTMKVSKGLEFPVVALPGVGHMPAPGQDEKEAARVFYVAGTRATQRLMMGVQDEGKFGQGQVK